MAYTFGAAGGDDIATTLTATFGANASSCFIAGWWKPTTLTATRGLWSAGNTFGAEIDTTTDELRMRTQNATTNGQWTTTGVDMVVDQWIFLAFWSVTAQPNTTWTIWRGTAETDPTQVTVTQATAPVGNVTGSTALTFGNKGTASLAFQGQVGWVTTMINTSLAQGVQTLQCTSTTILAAEVQYVYDRLVVPLWRGQPPDPSAVFGPVTFEATMWDGLSAVIFRRIGQNSAMVRQTSMTVSGATISQERPPKQIMHPWISERQRVIARR